MYKSIVSLALLVLLGAAPPGKLAPQVTHDPAYAANGDLLPPADYRDWAYLTSGIDMAYTASSQPDHHMFDNVFVNPESYRAFLATGMWPDKTTFVLEFRGADSPISINKRGHTQSTEVMGHEVHVKDHGEWRFYDWPAGAAQAAYIPRPASCYSCHEAHAAVQTTFVQFYPTLFPVAEQKKTISAAYLKESAAAKP
jgi:hypothetical protein